MRQQLSPLGLHAASVTHTGGFTPLCCVCCHGLASWPTWLAGRQIWQPSACGCRGSSWRRSAAAWTATGSC